MQIYIRAYCSPQNHSGSQSLYSTGNAWATLCCCHFFSPEPLIHTQSPSTVNKTENICENFMTSLNFVVRLQPDTEKRLWPNKEWLCFQHWTAPKILQSNNRFTNVCEMGKRRRVVTLSYLEVILNLSFLEGSRQISPPTATPNPIPPPPSPRNPKGIG